MTLPTFTRDHYREIIGQPIPDVVRRARECGVLSSPQQIVDAFNRETMRLRERPGEDRRDA